jgi:hypothetical protein
MNRLESHSSLHGAIDDFENALNRAPDEPVEWGDRVAQAAQRARAQISQHAAATEGPDGFHDEIRDAAPRLAHAVGALADDHIGLEDLIDEIDARARAVSLPDDIDPIRELGGELVVRVRKHKERGADLLHEAVDRELGVGD